MYAAYLLAVARQDLSHTQKPDPAEYDGVDGYEKYLIDLIRHDLTRDADAEDEEIENYENDENYVLYRIRHTLAQEVLLTNTAPAPNGISDPPSMRELQLLAAALNDLGPDQDPVPHPGSASEKYDGLHSYYQYLVDLLRRDLTRAAPDLNSEHYSGDQAYDRYLLDFVRYTLAREALATKSNPSPQISTR